MMILVLLQLGEKKFFTNININFFGIFGYVALFIVHGLFFSSILGIDHYATSFHFS